MLARPEALLLVENLRQHTTYIPHTESLQINALWDALAEALKPVYPSPPSYRRSRII